MPDKAFLVLMLAIAVGAVVGAMLLGKYPIVS
jgi:hypothetical protein